MRTNTTANRQPPTHACASGRAGGATITMLILATAAMIVISSLLNFSANDTRLSRIALDQQKAYIAAEAGLDYGVMQMHNLLSAYRLDPQVAQQDLLDSVNMIPAPPTLPGPYVYADANGNSFFSISVDTPIVSGVLTQGNYSGNSGYYQLFTITSGVSNTITGTRAKLQEHIQAFALNVVGFGVFYQSTLEVQPGSTMTFKGPVHCNGNMYIGGPLTFYDKVTTAGGIYVRRLDDGTTLPEPKIQDTHNTVVSMLVSGANTAESSYLDSSNANWTAQSLTRWQGQILTGAQGVSPMNPPIDPLSSPHAIIERSIAPPASGQTNLLYNKTTESAKFSNTTALRIYVQTNRTIVVTDIFSNSIIRSAILSSNTVSFTNPVVLQTSGSYAGYSFCTNLFTRDSDGNYSMIKTGIVGVGQYFYDARQMTNMAPVDLYVDKLLLNFPDLYQSYTTTQGQSAIYITSDAPTNGCQPCIRIRNASNLLVPITIASDLPVYIDGSFNKTNNYNITAQPACIAGDAITMLSSSWQDARSTAASSVRIPVNTTYNLVMMSGNLVTSTGNYNGGLENELRFLENWAGYTVTFRGSVINLWTSQKATGAWGGSNSKGEFVYGVPGTRDWGYDQIYRIANPPDIPMVYGMEEIYWQRANW